MNKNKFTEFFKGKGYYVLLFVGVIAIGAVAIIGSQLSSQQQEQEENIVDLNDVDDNIAAGEDDTQLAENNPVSEGVVNNANNSSDDTVTKDNSSQDTASSEDLIEYEGYAEDKTEESEQAQAEEPPAAVETAGGKLQSGAAPSLENLSFHAEDGLAWPVTGNVIMNYSMDHTIYFATLMQYKCNPALIIDAEVGTDVKAAADGVVSRIETNNEETGLTVTMNIGDGYSVVYGQLADVTLEEGDSIREGDVIGTINEPTKYYALEGSNLYFMVLEDEQTINPMLLLR